MPATEDPGVRSLAVDGAYVYWTTPGGRVKRVSISGGTPEVVASGQPAADNLVVDDTHLAWSVGDVVSVVEKATGAMISVLARISALIPPPRFALTRFAGVLAPSSPWRADVVACRRAPPSKPEAARKPKAKRKKKSKQKGATKVDPEPAARAPRG